MLNARCAACGKADPPQRCSRCQNVEYCDETCQRANWKAHKKSCHWYASIAAKPLDDGSTHFGALELVTWTSTIEGEDIGWGAVFADEAENEKKRFEGPEFNSDLRKFYEYRPEAFRWTCCGGDASIPYGCDHHGTGPLPCSCDYCRDNEAIPASLMKENAVGPYGKGLQLSRGPDPRWRRQF